MKVEDEEEEIEGANRNIYMGFRAYNGRFKDEKKTCQKSMSELPCAVQVLAKKHFFTLKL